MSHPDAEARYERTDAVAGPVVLAGLVLALVVGLALAASAWLSQTLVEGEPRATEAEVPGLSELQPPPEAPALQSQPTRELRQQRAWEEEQLHGTAWVDPVNRVVRIPIERALELSLTEGFPVRAQGGAR